jgi:hypothetical protein
MPTYDRDKATVTFVGFQGKPVTVKVADIKADVGGARGQRLRDIADLIFERSVRIPRGFPTHVTEEYRHYPPHHESCPCVVEKTCDPFLDAAECGTCGGWSTDVEDGRCRDCRSLPGEVA